MARGDPQADKAATTANANAGTFTGNTNALYSTLTPRLMSEAAHPAGYNPTDLASMQTEALQDAGGTQAAAVGQGALLGSRTRNMGAATKAISDAARTSSEDLSKNALGVRTGNARLKEAQRRAALSSLEGLTTAEGGLSNAALGAASDASRANTQAKSQSWDWASKLLAPVMGAAGSSAGAYYGAH